MKGEGEVRKDNQLTEYCGNLSLKTAFTKASKIFIENVPSNVPLCANAL